MPFYHLENRINTTKGASLLSYKEDPAGKISGKVSSFGYKGISFLKKDSLTTDFIKGYCQ